MRHRIKEALEKWLKKKKKGKEMCISELNLSEWTVIDVCRDQ
jgi:hypothetical protein